MASGNAIILEARRSMSQPARDVAVAGRSRQREMCLASRACPAPLWDGILRRAPGAAHQAQIAVAPWTRMSGRVLACRRELMVLKRIAKRTEFVVGDAVEIELQLQLGHVEKQLRLAQAGFTNQRDQLLDAGYRALKPFVP